MVKVRVPATTANMGPGFDVMGLALNIHNTFSFEECEAGLTIEGCPGEYCTPDNLCVVGYRAAMEEMGLPVRGLSIGIETGVPVTRGLGSSATCIVGGIFAANEMHGRVLKKCDMLKIATRIEGHPDNVAPALLGGLVTAFVEESGEVVYAQHPVDENLRFYIIVPDFHLSTAKARDALPGTLSYADAVYNMSHMAVLLRALETGDRTAIGKAMKDRMHEPYRKGMIAHFSEVEDMAYALGAHSFSISGAGPSMMAIADPGFGSCIRAALRQKNYNWQVLRMKPDFEGAARVKGKRKSEYEE